MKSFPEILKQGECLAVSSVDFRNAPKNYFEDLIKNIMKSCGRDELAVPVYMGFHEMDHNASKALIKRVYFEEYGIDPESPESYSQGIKQFHNLITDGTVSQYFDRLVEEGRGYTVRLDHMGDALGIQFVNDFPLYEEEEKRVRGRFAGIMETENLYDFYMGFADATEGAGMGIALISVILRQLKIDSHNFTIFRDFENQISVSRMIIPLNDSFQSSRHEFEQISKESPHTEDELRRKIRSGELNLKMLPASG